jgi:hypothetical protein
MSDWIMTASGRQFWPLTPRLDDIVIEDIAHHLAALPRFNGATRRPYSVAQHSVLVSRRMEILASDARHWATVGLYGLLHDGSEAYLLDVPRPLKHLPAFAPYRAAEKHLQGLVYQRFGLDPAGEPADLALVDLRMLRTEQLHLMPPPAPGEDRDDVPVYEFRSAWSLDPWDFDRARNMFLDRFAMLCRHRDAAASLAEPEVRS